MTSIRVPTLARAAAAALLLTGCLSGTEPDPGPAPFDMVIISGDGQSAPRGALLPEPLLLETVDFEGEPVEGAVVDWSVSLGDVEIALATTTSDAFGRTQNAVRLGQEIGLVLVSAQLRGTPAEVFFTSIVVE